MEALPILWGFVRASRFAERDRNTADFFLDPSVPVILMKLDKVAISSQPTISHLKKFLLKYHPLFPLG